MRLRTKIGAAMAVSTLTVLAATGLFTARHVTRTIQDEARHRLYEATFALGAEWRALSASASAELVKMAHSSQILDPLEWLARGLVSPASREVTSMASRVAPPPELDFFQIFNDRGIVISSRHRPNYYGLPDSAGWEIVTHRAPFPVAHLRTVRGRTTIAVESGMRVEAAGRVFHLVGGVSLTPEMLGEIGRRTGGDLYLQMSDGSRIVPPGVVIQDIDHLADARLENYGGSPFVVGRPPAGEAAGISILPIRRPDGTAFGELVLTISQVRLVALARELSGTFLWIGAAGVLLAWILSFWIARRITRPIENLARAARRVGAGRAAGDMPLPTDDEVGDLIRSFGQMTSDLSESRRQLVRAERIAAWREIARRMAHEIKNTLSPIQICVETIERGHRAGRKDFDEIMAEAVQTVRDEVAGLRNLVNDFSDFARMPDLNLTRTSPGTAVERAVALHQNNPKGIPIRCDAAGLPDISVDSDALARAVGNIILNAVEASPAGESVEVKALVNGDQVEISVEDRGPGIPVPERERVFEPYYTTKDGGSGLGLAIAYKIVSEHGGRIEIGPGAAGGSRFRILLPVPGEVPAAKAGEP